MIGKPKKLPRIHAGYVHSSEGPVALSFQFRLGIGRYAWGLVVAVRDSIDAARGDGPRVGRYDADHGFWLVGREAWPRVRRHLVAGGDIVLDGNAALTPKQRERVRDLYAGGEKQADLARRSHVTARVIREAVRGIRRRRGGKGGGPDQPVKSNDTRRNA